MIAAPLCDFPDAMQVTTLYALNSAHTIQDGRCMLLLAGFGKGGHTWVVTVTA